MPNNTREAIEAAVFYSSMGGIGGLVHYLDQVRKGQKFKFGLALINVIISAWIGWMIQPMIPEAIQDGMRYSITSASGFLSYPIIMFLENKGFDLILKRISK